jgi:hypothetical protein
VPAIEISIWESRFRLIILGGLIFPLLSKRSSPNIEPNQKGIEYQRNINSIFKY